MVEALLETTPATPPATPPGTPEPWHKQYESNPVLKESKIIQRFKTQEEALVALDHAERRLSQKLTDYPAQDAKEEDVISFVNGIRTKLPESFRVPEKPDGYKITATIKGADGKEVPIALDEPAMKEMQAACHEAGVDQRTFNRLVSHIFHAFQELPKQYASDLQNYLKEQSKTNPRTPKYEEFKATANKEFEFWPDYIKNYVKAKNLPVDAIALIAHHYAKERGEDTLPPGGTPPGGGKTLEEIQTRKSALLNDKEYKKQRNMGQGPLWDEFNGLMAQERKILTKKG